MSQHLPPEQLADRLHRHGQPHVLNWWDDLDDTSRGSLIEHLDAVDLPLIESLIADIQRETASARQQQSRSVADRARRAAPPRELIRLPSTASDRREWQDAARRGRELLAAGRVGAILVAGGQGTRLGFPHPKGMFPIGPVTGRSLFQIFAEQLLACARTGGRPIPYYVMTSDATHAETLTFFERYGRFGLADDDLKFFCQGSMPAVDARTGRLLMADKNRPANSPDGHGGLVTALDAHGLLADMVARGVDVLYYHQVDNPTAIVCDPAFLGWHDLRQSEMSTKVVARRSADERMGVLVDVDGRTQIIEYSDLPPDIAAQSDEAGGLKLWAGNTAIHAFNRAFLERLAADAEALPFHLAHKQVPYVDDAGRRVEPAEPNAVKFERFIFDALPLAERTLVVEADRSVEFNPVKNAEGDDSPATARSALTKLYTARLQAAGVVLAKGSGVEISPLSFLWKQCEAFSQTAC